MSERDPDAGASSRGSADPAGDAGDASNESVSEAASEAPDGGASPTTPEPEREAGLHLDFAPRTVPVSLAPFDAPPGPVSRVTPGSQDAIAPDEDEEPAEPEFVEPPAPPIVDVEDLDWEAIRRAVDPDAVRARIADTVTRLERQLDEGRPLLFDRDRAEPGDRAIQVRDLAPDTPLWFLGDLHGDLLTLEAALALVRRDTPSGARLVLLGDLFDDGGYGLEVLLRVFELLLEVPDAVCVIAGNHDEALRFDGERFSATVSPSDFTDVLNARLDDEWVRRAGQLAIRLFERAPRALFLPDELLVAHGGIPLADLHAELLERGDWNDPRCLQDFVWTRAHPRARRKIPNRVSRGSQFGHEDFAAFCAVSAQLGRPVRRMVRGHDHEEERFAMHPAWAAHPLLTTVAMSRRLPREAWGPYVRVPTTARWIPGTLPQVHRLHLPEAIVRELYPEPSDEQLQREPAEGGTA